MKKVFILSLLVVLLTALVATPLLAAGLAGGNGGNGGNGGDGGGNGGDNGGSGGDNGGNGGAGGDQVRNQYAHMWQGDRFALVGQVTEASAGQITVDVWMGNRLVKDYINAELTIQTDGDTRFRRFGDDEHEFVTFAEIVVGEFISAGGVVTEDEHFMAERVTINIPIDALN